MFKKILVIFVILGLLAVGGGAYFVNKYMNTPSNFIENKTVLIEKGMGLNTILEILKAGEIVKYPKIMSVMAKYYHFTAPKYGEYIFEPKMTPKQILEKMQKGDVVIRKFTIPEGKTVYEIMELMGDIEGLAGTFPDDIEEGAVLPQTYLYHYGDYYEDVVFTMKESMRNAMQTLWPLRQAGLPLNNPYEALVLASIVQKEAGSVVEMPIVASVFVNRLRLGMPLQSDPTAVYGITGGAPLGHLPLAADMKHDSPYNTYKIKALPPGPICSPGIDAIKAVLNPATTDYLFFVANGHGAHNFSKSLADHNNKVTDYRKVRKEQKKTKKH